MDKCPSYPLLNPHYFIPLTVNNISKGGQALFFKSQKNSATSN